MFAFFDQIAMISLLDAATSDLAQLIDRLDLEATPAPMPMSGRPQSFISPSEVDSCTRHCRPLKSPIKTLCASTASVSSLHTICQGYIAAAAVHRADHRIMGFTQRRDSPAKSSSPPKGAKELNEDYTNGARNHRLHQRKRRNKSHHHFPISFHLQGRCCRAPLHKVIG